MKQEKEIKIALRCMAYPGKNGDQDGYYAVCLDLSLVTWRHDFQSAKKSLNQAIFGYLETKAKLATKEDLQDLKKYILCPAPIWPFAFRYLLVKWFFSKIPRSQAPKTFNKPFDPSDFAKLAAGSPA